MILDTNALSALVDGASAIEKLLKRASFLALPVIVLGEYRYGISRSSRRAEYESWLARDLSLFQILDVSMQTSVYYASIRLELKEKGRPIPENDIWIAALAKQYEMPIISRDTHFKNIKGISFETW